jgi:hypothetical protein
VHGTTYEALREVSPLLASRTGLNTAEDPMGKRRSQARGAGGALTLVKERRPARLTHKTLYPHPSNARSP